MDGGFECRDHSKESEQGMVLELGMEVVHIGKLVLLIVFSPFKRKERGSVCWCTFSRKGHFW